MKYSVFLFIFVMNICASAQNNRGLQPCFQLSDSLGTAVERWTSFQPYEPEPYWYMPAKADVGFYYANADPNVICSGKQLIRKPIVIIDGFDAGDKRKFPQIYSFPDTNNSIFLNPSFLNPKTQ